MELPPLSDYEVYEQIGKGTWGVVYKARRLADDRIVALKFLDPTPTALDQMKARHQTLEDVLQREQMLAAGVLSASLDTAVDGTKFIVMPYLDRFLSDIDPTSLSHEEIYSIAKDLAASLAQIHKAGRVHGDISLQNVAYTTDKTVAITDFGSSTALHTQSGKGPIGRLGTRPWELNERGSNPTTQSDVWAYGSILHYLYTGKYPVQVNGWWDDILREGLLKGKDVDKRMVGLMGRCLRFSSQKRPRDGSALRDIYSEMERERDTSGEFRFLMRTISACALSGMLWMAFHLPDRREPIKLPQPKFETLHWNYDPGGIPIDDAFRPEVECISSWEVCELMSTYDAAVYLTWPGSAAQHYSRFPGRSTQQRAALQRLFEEKLDRYDSDHLLTEARFGREVEERLPAGSGRPLASDLAALGIPEDEQRFIHNWKMIVEGDLLEQYKHPFKLALRSTLHNARTTAARQLQEP